MVEMVLRLTGKHYARLLAFVSFMSLIGLTWWWLFNSEPGFSNSRALFAGVVFLVMGLFSGVIASAEGDKKQ